MKATILQGDALARLRHGREYIGIELNPKYVALAERRIAGDAPMFNTVNVSSP